MLHLWHCRRAATAIEYALIAATLSIAIAGTIELLGIDLVTNFFTVIANLF